MEKLSKHFSREEFACKCGCGFDTVDTKLLEILEDIREFYKKPVKITSGCRCPEYNKQVGGRPHSFHVKGRAADIQVQDVPPQAVQAYLKFKYDTYGIGSYDDFTHVDSRSYKGRW